MDSLEYRVIKERDTQSIENAQQLFREYQQTIGLDLSFQNFDSEVQNLPGKYSTPNGLLIVVYADNRPFGCGALRKLEEGIVELKRVYVCPIAQGSGLGRKISEHLIQQARMMGYHKLRLDTFTWMDRAVALYRKLGFVEIPPYYPHSEPDALFMELILDTK